MSLSEALPTKAIDTVSEELVQGPYVAARAGFEPLTLRSRVRIPKGINSISRGIDSTDAPPCPTNVQCSLCFAEFWLFCTAVVLKLFEAGDWYHLYIILFRG